MNRRRGGMTLIELMIALILLDVLFLELPQLLRHARRAEARADATLDALARREQLARTLRADLDRATRIEASAAGLALESHDARVTWTPSPAGLVRHAGNGDRTFAGARLLERTGARTTPGGRLVTCALGTGASTVFLTRLLPEVTR